MLRSSLSWIAPFPVFAVFTFSFAFTILVLALTLAFVITTFGLFIGLSGWICGQCGYISSILLQLFETIAFHTLSLQVTSHAVYTEIHVKVILRAFKV